MSRQTVVILSMLATLFIVNATNASSSNDKPFMFADTDNSYWQWSSSSCSPSKAPPDPVCSMLYDNYVKRPVKMSADIVMASCDIIAVRGRSNGFWETVMDDFNSVDENQIEPYLRILGKMLEEDALARNQNKTDQVLRFVVLPANAHNQIMERAKKTTGRRLDFYLIALARERNEQSKDFLNDVFQRIPTSSGKYRIASSSTQFYAAVALANIGEDAGIEWLMNNIDNPSDKDVLVGSVIPRGAASQTMSACCIAALRCLAGYDNQHLTSKSDFNSWWKSIEKPFHPRDVISFVDMWR